MTVLPVNVLLVATTVAGVAVGVGVAVAVAVGLGVAVGAAPGIVKIHTILADIAASLILVAIVHHEVEAILVTWDQVKRGQVPAAFGAVALVRWGGRRHRIGAWPQVPVVRSRVSVRSDRYCVGLVVLSTVLTAPFHVPKTASGGIACAAKLPVARKRVPRICRHVCNVHRWEHWATRRVGAPLSLCGTQPSWVITLVRSCREPSAKPGS